MHTEACGAGRGVRSRRRGGVGPPVRHAHPCCFLPPSSLENDGLFVTRRPRFTSRPPRGHVRFPVWGYSRMKPLGTLLSESLQRHDFISQACVCFRRTCPMFCHVALKCGQNVRELDRLTPSPPRGVASGFSFSDSVIRGERVTLLWFNVRSPRC